MRLGPVRPIVIQAESLLRRHQNVSIRHLTSYYVPFYQIFYNITGSGAKEGAGSHKESPYDEHPTRRTKLRDNVRESQSNTPPVRPTGAAASPAQSVETKPPTGGAQIRSTDNEGTYSTCLYVG